MAPDYVFFPDKIRPLSILKSALTAPPAISLWLFWLCYIFYYIGYNLFTIGLAFEGIFGLSPLITLPLASLLLGAYVTLGGQTAVIFTDLAQGADSLSWSAFWFLALGCLP